MVAALIVHGTVLGTVHALGISVVGDGFRAKAHGGKPAPADDLAALKASCKSDALLAGSARASMCLAPWHDDVDRCLAAAQNDLLIDLSTCEAMDLADVAPIAMLEPREIAKVKPIDPEPLLEAMQQPKPPPPPPPVPQPHPNTPPPPPPPPAPARPQQVVETAKPTQDEAPDNARFLSEYNTKVDKQTVARGAVTEPMVAKSKPKELTPTDHPKEASVKDKPPDLDPGRDRRAPDVPGSLAMRTPGAPSPAELQQDAKTRGATDGATGPLAFDGFVPRRGDGAIEQQRHDRSEQPRGQNGAGGGAPRVPNLHPTDESMERLLGGGSVDHLDDVSSGDETALNSKRWIYASFFNRLKRQVAQNWDPASVWRRRDPTGQVYGYKTRITEVRVSLLPSGKLAKIVVTAPSGVAELDDEAVRSFHAASPFPNPPKELVQSDRLITFAFSFYFEIGAPHTAWRVLNSL